MNVCRLKSHLQNLQRIYKQSFDLDFELVGKIQRNDLLAKQIYEYRGIIYRIVNSK